MSKYADLVASLRSRSDDWGKLFGEEWFRKYGGSQASHLLDEAADAIDDLQKRAMLPEGWELEGIYRPHADGCYRGVPHVRPTTCDGVCGWGVFYYDDSVDFYQRHSFHETREAAIAAAEEASSDD